MAHSRTRKEKAHDAPKIFLAILKKKKSFLAIKYAHTQNLIHQKQTRYQDHRIWDNKNIKINCNSILRLANFD